MNRVARTIALVTVIAVAFPGFPSTRAATGANLQGIVQIPCDPSRLSEVAAVRLQPASGGSATTVVVDPSTGRFVGRELAEGKYELVALGADGEPLMQESTKVSLDAGPNTVILALEPAGCGEPGQEGGGVSKGGLKDWQLTLIYFGVVGAVILALSDDDEEPASPFSP